MPSRIILLIDNSHLASLYGGRHLFLPNSAVGTGRRRIPLSCSLVIAIASMDLRQGKLNPTTRADLHVFFFFSSSFSNGNFYEWEMWWPMQLCCVIFPHFILDDLFFFSLSLCASAFFATVVFFSRIFLSRILLDFLNWIVTRVLIVQVTWEYNGNKRIVLRGRSLHTYK